MIWNLKNRKVTLSLVTNTNVVVDTITLVGVTRVSPDTAMDVGEAYGLTNFFLNPWYVKAKKVSISGKSYMGAFSADIYNLSADTTVDDLNHIINLFDQAQGDPTRIILLTIGTEQFSGYITALSYPEDISNPFIFDYKIDFIGRSTTQDKVKDGKNLAANDLANIATTLIPTPVVNLTKVFFN